MHYDGANNYLFVNGLEIIKFKAKISETNAIPTCLGNISKDCSVNNIKNTGFYGYVYDFEVDCDAIAVDDILDNRKYLMKTTWYSINKMFRFIKKMVFITTTFLDAMH